MTDEELAVQLVVEGMRQFLAQMKSADDAVADSAKGWGKFGDVAAKGFDAFQTVGEVALGAIVTSAAAAVTAIGAVGGAIVKLTLDAAPLKGVQDAFARMGDKFGVSLESMQQAAGGTISDFELMRMANVALTGAGEDFGREFGQNLPKLLEAARAAAKGTGQDVGFLFNSLVTGIKRGSPLLIDNTGLVLKVSEANQAMADSLGKTVDELTAEEKQIALLNATVEAGEQMVANFGGSQASAAEQIASLKVQIQNAKDQIGLAFLPVLQQVLVPLGELAATYIPKFVTGFQSLATHAQPVFAVLGQLKTAFDTFTWALDVGIAPLDALKLALQTTFGAEAATTVMNFIGGIQAVFESVRPFIEQFAATFQKVWGYIQAAIAQAVPVIIQYVQMMIPIFEQWGAFIMQVVQQVVAFALPLIESMAAFFAEKIGFIVAWVQQNMPLFQAVFESTLARIQAIWNAVWPAIQVFVQAVWTTIKTLIDVALQAITGFITAFLQVTQGDWSAAWETIKTTAAAIWDAIKTGFSQFVSGILTAMGTTLSEVKTVWQNNWDALVTIVKTIWGKIETAIADAITSIKSFFATADWGEIGRNIITGIANGIKSAAGLIANAAKGAAQGALNAAKNFLDSHSPSGVFRRQIGQSIGAGIALGIKDLAPTINAQIRAVTAPVTTGAGNSQTMNVTNNYNLTTNSLTRPGGLALEFAAMEMGSR